VNALGLYDSNVASLFSPKTISFLRALKRNNRREWFLPRKEQYEAHVRAPMVALIERLADDMRSFAPELACDPKVSLFRVYRDTRFSSDKTPYKTHVAARFPMRSFPRGEGAGLYFEIAPGWVWMGGGLWRPDTSQLHLVREHIAENHKRLTKIVTSPRMKKLGGLQGDRLTRVPRGFAKDDPAAEYLKHYRFVAGREFPVSLATSEDFYPTLIRTFRALMPLVRFLNEPLINGGQGS